MGFFGKKQAKPQLSPEIECEKLADRLSDPASIDRSREEWEWAIFVDGELAGMACPPIAFMHDSENDCEYEIVGESHYLDWLRMVRQALGGDPANAGDGSMGAILVRDFENEYDDHAVAVTIGGRRVGYIPRGDARFFANLLERLAEVDVMGIQVPAEVGWAGGERSDVIGVRLDLPPQLAHSETVIEVRPIQVSG